MANRLQHENSLYLRQHADNPVDWFPWGEEAFARAKEEKKPVLISIGYSACHWCHVMAHESFEDAYIAGLMNQHFVCIKVDREEHPEVDRIYMDTVQMLNGHGGWPLNVFCLSDGRPFAGGTYFPPDERRGQGIVPWPQLLMRIADFHQRSPEDLAENAKAILGNLAASNQPLQTTGDGIENRDFFPVLQSILERHDDDFGGFGDAPKFPPSMTLDFLLAMRSTATVDALNPDLAERIDQVVNTTLTAMAHGGLYDQVGGGFSRYSVDRHWLIPHFEKMLYDNALLLRTYATAFSRYPKPLYGAVVEETIEWLKREMGSPETGFAAALDADSEGEEGLYYLWTPSEVKAILGEESGAGFCHAYGITGEGNFENSGKSHAALLEPDFKTREDFREERAKLLQARAGRLAPGLDEKRIVGWNALLVSGIARAARVFGRDDWLVMARETAEWIWARARTEEDRLAHVLYGTEPHGNGILEDYALAAESFLELAAVIETSRPGEVALWIKRARVFTDAALTHFRDDKAVGFFNTSDDHARLVHRQKDWTDNATPAGNSSLLHALAGLDALTGEAPYAAELKKMRAGYPGLAERAPQAVPYALTAYVYEAMGIAMVKAGQEADLSALAAAVRDRPWRPVFLLPGEEIPESQFQLCVGTQCQTPEADATRVAAQL